MGFWIILALCIMVGMYRAHHKEWASIDQQQAKLNQERSTLENYHRALDEWAKIIMQAQKEPT